MPHHGVVSAEELRSAMRTFPTGVVALTSVREGTPVGATLGSFFSISLRPALVGFSISRDSATWRSIGRSGRLGIDVLAVDQESVGLALAASGDDKFEGISWRRSDNGLPIIDGCIAHFECRVENCHRAGDHFVVVARVEEVRRLRDVPPLVHCDRTFHQLAAVSAPYAGS
jgi:3-hydroxy-9,10-secoandrosta-1,3,5(10)-triene-9,17-dione monooxygenase reductase component